MESARTIKLQGVTASPGLACGISFVHYEQLGPVKLKKLQPTQVKSEISRLNKAIETSKKGLESLRTEAKASVGTDLSKIFDAQLMILEDDDFMAKVRDGITQRLENAEYVYTQEVNKTIRALARSKDQYMREMISDIDAVSARLLHNLSGLEEMKRGRSKLPVIVFANFFSPAEIMHMKESNVTGFVTETGGPTSHMALFAKALGIPAIVGVKGCLEKISAGSRVCMDGHVGEVYISPDDDRWKFFKKEIDAQKRRDKKRFAAIGAIPSTTLDGHKIEVEANLEVPTEYDRQLADESIGVGLYRTEFLYLSHKSFPDEDEQFEMYSRIVRQFKPKPVTLRTFDLGGDKFTEHFEDEGEANPALGWRAIRYSLDAPAVFRTQLRAIMRASVYGNVRLMFPMISSVEQIIRAKRILSSVKAELSRKKIPYDDGVKIGIMVEIPSAVVMASRFALEVDFFSIGTNDLTQYALAVDRGNTKVAKWYRHLHPAVLKMVADTVQAGHDCDIEVGLCGELAGDPRATRLLVGLGLDSLSVSPSSLHAVKELIPNINFSEAASFAEEILTLQRASEVEDTLNRDYQNLIRKAIKQPKGHLHGR